MTEGAGWSVDAAWKRVTDREFRDWQGLPAGVRYTDFDGRFPRLANAEAVGLMGRSLVSARYRMHVAEGYPQNLKAWFAAGQLLAVDAVLPDLAHSAEELRSALGDPSLRLDSVWEGSPMPGALQVFASRGVALLEGPGSQVLRLVLFRPDDDFVKRVHTESRPVERP